MRLVSLFDPRRHLTGDRMRLPHPTALALGLALGLALPLSAAANTKVPAKPASKTKPKSSKPATARKTATAPAPKPGQVLTEAQMLMANQVLTGRADCEFKQYVVVERVGAGGGSFRVRHSGRTYNMVPEETSTGAVRLVDQKSGVVWIQIPVKSMLLNHRVGRRIIDACASPAQRQAQADADAAAAAATATQSVPPSMLGREDSIPAGIMYGPAAAAAAASAPAPLIAPAPPGRL
jgi:hypothetical protein